MTAAPWRAFAVDVTVDGSLRVVLLPPSTHRAIEAELDEQPLAGPSPDLAPPELVDRWTFDIDRLAAPR